MAVNFCLDICFLQGLSQLIGAGGGLHAALDAFDAGDDILNIHAFYQSGDALQIAVAAADKLHILNLVVLDIKENALGAGAFGLVLVAHNNISFLY